MDPAHDYALRKAVQIRHGDDELDGMAMSKIQPGLLAKTVKNGFTSYPVECNFSLEDVKCDLVEGRWVPTSAVLKAGTTYADKRAVKEFDRISRTYQSFSPDFVKIGAFVLDCPNGTPILGSQVGPVRMRWKDGNPAPDVDRGALSEINETISKLPTLGASNSSTPQAIWKQHLATLLLIGGGAIALAVLLRKYIAQRVQRSPN